MMETGSKFGKVGVKIWSKFGSETVSKFGTKKWPKRGQKSGPNGVKKVVQTGSKFGSKKVSRNGSKKVIKTGSKFGPNEVKFWHQKRMSRNWGPETTSEKFLGQIFRFWGSVYRSFVVVLGSWVSACLVIGILLVFFGERNCSVAKIVGRNPDDSGQ